VCRWVASWNSLMRVHWRMPSVVDCLFVPELY
jgi:hypothetical protein